MSVNSYYRPVKNSKSIKLEDSQQKTKTKRLSISKIINFVLIISIVGLVVFATTLSSSPEIQLKKKDIQYYDTVEYQNAAKEFMSDSILNKSKLLFQSTTFESKMRDRFPEISQIASIAPLGGRDLTVVISVSDPFATLANGSQIGILNSDGVLVSTNNLQSDDSGLVKIRFITPQENFNVGSRILTEQEVGLISELDRELDTMTLKDGSKLQINEVLFNVSNGQMEVKFNEKPYYLKLSTFGDADLQVGAVKASLRQLDKDNTLPTKYLDVRVPNRVFCRIC
ncbi:MAG: hypothetical protein [Circular genetic element sp.]|nr:MAG: hypothetical protein [Circular genetic element sp.]